MYKHFLFVIRVLLIMVIVFSWNLSPASAENSTKATCAGITEIPSSECEVLLEIYNDFGLSAWGGPNAWFINTMPSMWGGLYIEDGHVIDLKPTSFGDFESDGVIPEKINQLTHLEIFSFKSVHVTGSIPTTLWSLTTLEEVIINSSRISGPLIIPNIELLNLQKLDLRGNLFSGNLSVDTWNMPALRELYLQNNLFTGEIPSNIDKFSNLIFLNFSSNSFSGAIPSSVGNLSNLKRLNLSKNSLSGSIPQEIGNLNNLYELVLTNNQLTGSIPFQIGNFDSISQLWLNNNQLTGSIPASLWTYPHLDMLILSNNQLEGSIPIEIKNLTILTFLDLSNNKLTGVLPAEIGDLTNLNYLILENNQFSGAIPDEIGSIPYLYDLNLRNNHFSGTIPTSLGNIIYLHSLDLSGNRLMGDVPESLASLSYLADPGEWEGGLDGLYLDYNQLNVPDPYPADPPTALQTLLLQKDPDWQLTQSVKLPLSNTGGTLVSRDNRAEINTPADAITTLITLQYNPQPEPQYNTGTLLFANTSFELLALDGLGDPIPQFAFEIPISVTLHYADLDIVGIDETTLKLYYWDADQQIWLDAADSCNPASEYQRDLVNNSLSVEICHLTEFALLGKEPITYNIFLPMLLK